MRYLPRALVASLTLCIAGCQATTRYTDITGLNRGQAELNVASAKCEMYARQIANQTMGNAAVGSLVMGSNYLAGAQVGTSIAMTRNYNTCLRSAGFMPKRS